VEESCDIWLLRGRLSNVIRLTRDTGDCVKPVKSTATNFTSSFLFLLLPLLLLFMAALWNTAGHYIFILSFAISIYLSSFFFLA